MRTGSIVSGHKRKIRHNYFFLTLTIQSSLVTKTLFLNLFTKSKIEKN